MYEIQAYLVIRRDGWHGKDKLDQALAEGWEPFAVTQPPNQLDGLLYHLRRKKPQYPQPSWPMENIVSEHA